MSRRASREGYFADQGPLEALLEVDPDPSNLSFGPGEEIVEGDMVDWDVSSCGAVLAPVDKIQFMEGNLWNPAHARALYDLIVSGDRPILSAPVGRFHRIDEDDFACSVQYEEEGELEYQMCMSRPWEKSDVGTFSVQLVDGNHRAIAAMAAGETHIPVYVNYYGKEDVLPREWIKGKKPKRGSRRRRKNPSRQFLGPEDAKEVVEAAQLALVVIWALKNSKGSANYSDLLKAVPASERNLKQALRRLQDCGYIDQRSGYHLYPAGYEEAGKIARALGPGVWKFFRSGS